MARTFRRGRSPNYSWVGLLRFGAVTVASTQQFLGSATLLAHAATIVRVRGDALVMMDVGAADEGLTVGMGLIVGSDDQVAIGSTAFPSPSDDLDADWLWHSFFSLRSITGSQSDADGGQVARAVIDSKAMRKVKANDNLVAMADSSIAAGSPTFDASGAFRILLQT